MCRAARKHAAARTRGKHVGWTMDNGGTGIQQRSATKGCNRGYSGHAVHALSFQQGAGVGEHGGAPSVPAPLPRRNLLLFNDQRSGSVKADERGLINRGPAGRHRRRSQRGSGGCGSRRCCRRRCWRILLVEAAAEHVEGLKGTGKQRLVAALCSDQWGGVRGWEGWGSAFKRGTTAVPSCLPADACTSGHARICGKCSRHSFTAAQLALKMQRRKHARDARRGSQANEAAQGSLPAAKEHRGLRLRLPRAVTPTCASVTNTQAPAVQLCPTGQHPPGSR